MTRTQDLNQFLSNPSIYKYVDLRNKNLTDQDAILLAEGLKHCPNLQYLQLYLNKISDRGAVAIEALKSCPLICRVSHAHY